MPNGSVVAWCRRDNDVRPDNAAHGLGPPGQKEGPAGKKIAGLGDSLIKLHSLEESGVKIPTGQLNTGTPQEHQHSLVLICFQGSRSSCFSSLSGSLIWGGEREDAAMDTFFLEVGDTYVFVSAVHSVSTPPIRALAGNERHPDRDRVLIALSSFGCVVWFWVFLLLHTGAWLSPKFQLSTCRWSL